MTEPELKQLLTAITPPSETARAAAHAHWASLAHWRPCWKMPPP